MRNLQSKRDKDGQLVLLKCPAVQGSVSIPLSPSAPDDNFLDWAPVSCDKISTLFFDVARMVRGCLFLFFILFEFILMHLR